MQKENKRVVLPLVGAGILAVGLAIGFTIQNTTNGLHFFQNQKLSPKQEILRLIQYNYVDEVSTDSLANLPIDTILHRLDPHSAYIPPENFEDESAALHGDFDGLGFQFTNLNDTATLFSIVKNSPAFKMKLEVGDKLLEANNRQLVGAKLNLDSVKNILADAGNVVNLKILRDDKVLSFNIQKGEVPLPSLDAAYMIEPHVGYIKLNKFSETTYKEFMYNMEQLKKQGLNSLILDLRDNGGGLLEQAVQIADEFLSDNKLIVYTEGAHSPRKEYRCERDGVFETGKLVVLTNENTASASEVLAGALQDWDRATIVGRRTFGKGLVQDVYNLSNGGALDLTTARYYTPVGRNIQKSYAAGFSAYENDLQKRFDDGELKTGIRPDSAMAKSKAYKTQKGKIVYGGGGIIPDQFIPIDTIPLTDQFQKVFENAAFDQLTIKKYLDIKSSMFPFHSALEWNKSLQWNSDMNWSQIKQLNPELADINKAPLLQIYKAYLARFQWDNLGYFQIMNINDPFIDAAEKILK